MSHLISHFVFDSKMPRKTMLAAIQDWAREFCDPYEHSLDGNIDGFDVYDGTLLRDGAWHDGTVYACKQDAMDALSEGWSEALTI